MKKWRYLFRILIWIPFFVLIYKIFTNNLGAQPAEKLNRELGEWALRLFLLNLLIGAFLALLKPPPGWLRSFALERRYIGITTFIYLFFHVTFFFIKEGSWTEGINELFKRTYLIYGSLAFLILLLMFLTSNNLSVKLLKYSRWKNLHRSAYLALIFIALHRVLIEKANLVEVAVYFIPISLLELYRFTLKRGAL